ncbi:MAG: outer membrane beta-barrel protein [Flavobacteriaceae bacterium]|nr:outer membrane beta-barrel protein [Flavobacteriaceae bacterium]
MKAKITLLIVLNLLSFSLFSQTNDILIKGKVVDTSKQPVVYALITVFNQQNTTIVEQAVTNEQGNFTLDIKEGIYTFSISSVGFITKEEKVTIKKNFFLNFTLNEDINSLDEVVVVSKKYLSPIKVEGSKVTMNIQKNSLLKDVGNAIDVLKRTPSVFVNGQNEISISGLKGTKIFVNGKNVYVDAENLVAYLRSISSKDIAKIEVMHSPPAHYDANGTGGVINIQLTQKGEKGIHFSVGNTLSYWENLRHQMNASMSCGTDKWVLNTNYSHSLGHYNMAYGMNRWQGNHYISSETADTDKRKTINGKINVLWTPNDRNSVGIHLSINSLFGPGITNSESLIYSLPKMDLEKKLVGSNDYFKQRANRYSLGAFYQLDIAENSFYRIDLDMINYDGFSKNNQPNTYYDSKGTMLKDLFFRSNDDKNIMIYALSLKNHRPFLNGYLDAGIKTSNVHSENSFSFSKRENKVFIKDVKRSKMFNYNEFNAHGFLQYAVDLSKKYALKIGVRGEYTQIKGANSSQKNDFLNFFPNATLSYNSEPYRMELTYSKRIDRPKYESLNPFEYLLDELTYWKGNPFLEPQISDKVSLSYSVKNTSFTLSYNHLSNYMAYITDTFGNKNAVVMTTKNMGKKQLWAMNYIQTLHLLKNWNINIYGGIYYTLLDLEYTQNVSEKHHRWSAEISLQSSVQLPYKIDMNVNARYASKRPGNTYEIHPSSEVLDVGFSKNFLENNLKISLLATDIFHSEIWDNYGSKPNLKIENWGYGESRQIKLSVQYHFGSKPKQKVSENQVDEVNRL